MANLPEADQGMLDRMNAALQADPQFQYLSLHANNGDQQALQQLKDLAASKGFPVGDNATWAAGRFQNAGGSIPLWMKLAGVGLGGVGLAAPALFAGGGGAAAGAGGGAASAAPVAGDAALGGGWGAASAAPLGGGWGAAGASGVVGGTGAAGGTAAGGGALTTGGLLSRIGSGLTALNSGAAQGRAAEAQANQNQFGTQLKGLSAQLDRATLAKKLQEQDYQDQLRGALIQHMQDFQATPPPEVASHMGTVTGGARPSALGPDRGAIGGNIQNTATLDLLQKGDPNTGYTAASTAPMPTLPNLPSPNAGQSVLGYLAPGLSIAGLIKNYLNRQPVTA
jgi:hypothetical protein